jgi:hypothetical protein
VHFSGPSPLPTYITTSTPSSSDKELFRMTQITWDNIGERFYETGVDHGVLYLD